MSGEYLSAESELKRTIAAELASEPVLIPEHGVELRMATEEYAKPVADLYRREFSRGDYFASRYDRPGAQIFDPDWLEQEFQDPEHLRFVFTDTGGNLLGATGFFHDSDSESGPLMTSDATQIDPRGRGLRIMDHFFKRVVPIIEGSGAGLATDFVLTPESKGLRRTLQTDLGMIALGIHPHVLRHPELGITRSEISAAKYPNLTPKPVKIVPEFEPLYDIVRRQIPFLGVPDIVPARTEPGVSSFTDSYQEMEQTIDGNDPHAQLAAIGAGFRPVAYDPDRNSFRMARFPAGRPELDFILDKEHIEPNKLLVAYLNEFLYREEAKAGRDNE